MTILTAAITLILVMDPLGNIPVFISILNTVEPRKRSWIILRESLIAFIILVIFLFAGHKILTGLQITESALGIAGGIILFLISIKMIFPSSDHSKEQQIGEPFIVPLAVPLTAGPSAMATVMLFATQHPGHNIELFFALLIASTVFTITLLFSGLLQKLLGQKGLIAIERLMGMLLTTIAVQMFLSGLDTYFKLH